MIFVPIAVLVLRPPGPTNESDNHGDQSRPKCSVLVSTSVSGRCVPVLQPKVKTLSLVADRRWPGSLFAILLCIQHGGILFGR